MEIRLARPEEAEVLGAALADALADDPVFRWLIPATRRRDQRLLSFFTAVSSSYLRAGKPAYLADEDAGAALWSDPATNWRLQFDLGQLRAVFGSFGPVASYEECARRCSSRSCIPANRIGISGTSASAAHGKAAEWAARCSTRS